MELIKTKGLIIRSAEYGEYDKVLTVLTQELGKVSVVCKGAKSLKKSAAAEVFAYNDFVIYYKNGIYHINSCDAVSNFFGLSSDLSLLEAASQIVSFSNYICQENEPAEEILRITLNSLYALANLHKNPKQVFSAYYLKSLIYLGFEPELECCCACGETESLTAFSHEYGGVLCKTCAQCAEDAVNISQHVLSLMKYIAVCDIKKLFSFNAGEEVLSSTYELLKTFVFKHLEYRIGGNNG